MRYKLFDINCSYEWLWFDRSRVALWKRIPHPLFEGNNYKRSIRASLLNLVESSTQIHNHPHKFNTHHWYARVILHLSSPPKTLWSSVLVIHAWDAESCVHVFRQRVTRHKFTTTTHAARLFGIARMIEFVGKALAHTFRIKSVISSQSNMYQRQSERVYSGSTTAQMMLSQLSGSISRI